MERISTAAFQRDMTNVLQRVADGESVMLTHFGREVAILSPVVSNPNLDAADHVPSARHINPLMKKILRRE